VIWRERKILNRYEKVIIESFEKNPQQSISELFDNTNIPKRTLNRYIDRLIAKGEIEPIGEGRGRYYQRVLKPGRNTIAVFKSGELAGFLGYEEGRYLFEYEGCYKGKDLDGLPKNDILTSATLFAVFENLIPESDRRNAYLADGKNLAEILLELQNSHGDFDFIAVDKLHVYKNDYTNRPNWLLVKEKILQEQAFVNILDFKICIEREILEEKGKPYLGLNEHLFMSFAKNAYGFDVPWSAVLIGERDFHYLVKRYDRFDGYKYEQRDFAQIMNMKSDQKYFATSERLFDAIWELVKSKEEKIRFLEFYLFSFVIEHADLHLKNISVINIGKGKQRLSPLYDLISNGIYRGDTDELGLPLDGKKYNISLESFYSLAARIGISKLQTKKIAKNVIGVFIEKFPDCIEKCSKIEVFDNLKIDKERYHTSTFSAELEKFYDRRISCLKQRGFLKELGL